LFGHKTEAIAAVADEVARIGIVISGTSLAGWRLSQESLLSDCINYVSEINIAAMRVSCSDSELTKVEEVVRKIIVAASVSPSAVSPNVQRLIRDKESAEAIQSLIQIQTTHQQIGRIEALLSFTAKLEELVRAEIREQAYNVFEAISADIQRLWDLLRPGQQIREVRLYVPREADKSIDIALQFYGVEQESPRLTLSEGQRNALGLCIFLAMAKQSGNKCPIILDDVVVSMDRDHRSQVAALLEREFSDRQVILFTHDREWFFELGRFLKKPHWSSLRLMPWVNPIIGIRIADQSGDFAKARANILSDPEDAESNVRRIMDQGLAEIAERLEIPMPFKRGDDNDHRTAGQFIVRISGRASRNLKVRSGTDSKTGKPTYEKNSASMQALELIIPQLAAWANRATHTFSASSTEAATIIDNCEAALAVFDCAECNTSVWHCKIEEKNDLECRCGKLRWLSS
jgi:hypothetical protein